MKKIAVFCGSRMPKEAIYKTEALKLAQYFVKNNIALVYGGAKVGIMGIIADAMIEQKGYVIGVMPKMLSDKEIMHTDLSETYIVSSMHERKAMMMDMSDHFIAFPGGCGTMEEIFEVITWSQIGIHSKSYGFLNINGFYDGIKTYLDTAYRTEFLPKAMYDEIVFEDNFDDFIEKLI